MSPDRIRPGSARSRREPPPVEAGDDVVDDGEGLQRDEIAETPIAVPLALPDSVDPMIGGQEDEQFVGPQPGDEPLRPDEFVNLEAAEEVLGHEAVEAYRRGDRRPAPEQIDEVDEELLELDLAPSGPAVTPGKRHESFFSKLYHGRTRFDFVRHRRWWFTISLVVICAGAISLGLRGLNLGIDFAGGTSWQVRTATAKQSGTALINDAWSALDPLGLGGSTITILGSNRSTQTLEVQAKLAKGSSQSLSEIRQVSDTLASVVDTNPSAVSVTQVGPSWGSSVTDKAIEALIVFFILISLYISIFFEWRMALAAVIAVIHDVLVVVGIYSLTGFQVTPDTVVAILTILGYSLYDTIVVFDRIRDNVNSTAIGGSGRISISDIINLSMNQTLARSINTSLVAILPIFAVLILGADVLGATTLQYFGWALLIGLVSGAYSSIFIASPLVAMMKERQQRWRNVRLQLAKRGGDQPMLLSPEAVAAGVFGADGALATTRRERRAAGGSGGSSGRGSSAGSPRRSGGGGGGSSGGRITPGSGGGRAPAAGAAGVAGAAVVDEPDLTAGRVPAGSGSVRNGAARSAGTPTGRPPARRARKGRQR